MGILTKRRSLLPHGSFVVLILICLLSRVVHAEAGTFLSFIPALHRSSCKSSERLTYDACQIKTNRGRLFDTQCPCGRQSINPLFGIKGFRSWFDSTFPTSMVTVDTDQPRRFRNRHSQPDEGRSESNTSKPTVYDHVLIDANQFLHSTLRRAYNRKIKKSSNYTSNSEEILDSETIDVSLSYLLRELNDLISTSAVPRKSLVIALDGSPGAAKLDMQRRRRFGIYKKAEGQQRQMQVLKERGWRDSDFGFGFKGVNRGIDNIIMSKHDREQVSLNITPGTKYMDRVTDALLYWAWKCVSNPNWPDGTQSYERVKIYINPSYVPGEGEIKLLDWVMRGQEHSTPSSSQQQHKRMVHEGDSVAIIGGDSDLVLMGLVVPPSVTHNIHIILPREGKRNSFYRVSIWETTKMLTRLLKGDATYGSKKAKNKTNSCKKARQLTLAELSSAKMDAVVLIIMNGNDYLNKLRGGNGGFDAFFKSYLDVAKVWIEKRDDGGPNASLIHLDADNSLSINVPFALAFFRQLSTYSQQPRKPSKLTDRSDSVNSQLGVLNNLVEAKMIPAPMEFQTIRPGDSEYFQNELWEMNAKMKQNVTAMMEEVYGAGVEIVRLTLGPSSEDNFFSDQYKVETTVLGKSDGHGVITRMIKSGDGINGGGGRSYIFEVPHRQDSSMKATRHRLACLALEELFGIDNMEELFGYGDAKSNDEGVEDEDEDGFPDYGEVRVRVQYDYFQTGCC